MGTLKNTRKRNVLETYIETGIIFIWRGLLSIFLFQSQFIILMILLGAFSMHIFRLV